jgi:hypothetical protein
VIKANATVEDLGNRNYEVTVWGDEHRRVYTITALSDNKAAMEGIDRFVEEMEALETADAELDQATAAPEAQGLQ